MDKKVTTDPFELTIQAVRKTALDNIIKHGSKMFTVKTLNLPKVFLERFRGSTKREYKCQSCLDFLQWYGSTVVVDEFYHTVPLLWDEKDVPEQFVEVIRDLKREVESGRIIDAFYSTQELWGEEGSGRFQHFNADMSFVDQTSESDLDHKVQLVRRYFRFLHHVVTRLSDNELDIIKRHVMEGDDIDKDSKLELISIFKTIREEYHRYTDHRIKDNYLWVSSRNLVEADFPIENINISDLLDRAMQGDPKTAMEEFVKPDSTIEDILSAYVDTQLVADDTLSLSKFLKDNGYEDSFKRRYAKLEEVPVIWKPRKVNSNLDAFERVERISISWKDFNNEVLQEALTIQVVFENPELTNMTAVLTEQSPSKPIFKWDTMELRNPFSWYTLNSVPKLWGLKQNTAYDISAVGKLPSVIYNHASVRDYNGAIFYIEKARPYHKAGLGLFDKLLKDEFKPYEAAIQEYSKANKLTNNAEASACGVLVGANNYGVPGTTFIVRTARQIRYYVITK